MGAGSSRDNSDPQPARRKSRRKFYGVLKLNFDLIAHKLQPERLTDDECRIVRDLIDANRADLLAVRQDVVDRPKYKEAYDEFWRRCDEYDALLRAKRAPVSAPSSPSSSSKKRRKKKLEAGQHAADAPEAESFRLLHTIREAMQPLRDEVLCFKGARNDRIYHFLQESFHRYAQQLHAIEVHDRVQLKYEVRVAIAYAQESQEVLDMICAGRHHRRLQPQRSVDDSRIASFNATDYDGGVDDDYDDDEDDEFGISGGRKIKRNRSKSMGDYLNTAGRDDFYAHKRPFAEFPADSSGSEYALTSGDYHQELRTPPSIPQSRSYNFKVTSI